MRLRGLTDEAGLFRRDERDKIEDALQAIGAKFPQVFPVVYTKSLGDNARLRQFGFWVLNRGIFEDVEAAKRNDGGIAIVIDPDSKSAGITYGYLLDSFFEESDSFECLSRAHSHWLEGRYCDGLLKALAHLQKLLAKRSRRSPRGAVVPRQVISTEGGGA